MNSLFNSQTSSVGNTKSRLRTGPSVVSVLVLKQKHLFYFATWDALKPENDWSISVTVCVCVCHLSPERANTVAPFLVLAPFPSSRRHHWP